MAKSTKSKSVKKRVKVKDLPAAKEVTGKEMKRVKGGVLIGLLLPAVQSPRQNLTESDSEDMSDKL